MTRGPIPEIPNVAEAHPSFEWVLDGVPETDPTRRPREVLSGFTRLRTKVVAAVAAGLLLSSIGASPDAATSSPHSPALIGPETAPYPGSTDVGPDGDTEQGELRCVYGWNQATGSFEPVSSTSGPDFVSPGDPVAINLPKMPGIDSFFLVDASISMSGGPIDERGLDIRLDESTDTATTYTYDPIHGTRTAAVTTSLSQGPAEGSVGTMTWEVSNVQYAGGSDGIVAAVACNEPGITSELDRIASEMSHQQSPTLPFANSPLLQPRRHQPLP